MIEYRWAVVTGAVNIFKKSSRQGAKFMAGQDGFVTVHTTPECTLFFYKDLNSAKIARNRAEYHGIECGNNIIKFILDGNELIYCDSDSEEGGKDDE